MASPWPQRLCILAACALALILGLSGIGWGLPSRSADRYLFGDRIPWTGAEIVQKAGASAGSARGADMDANPLDRSKSNILNATDAQKAEIVRRYRLYSNQPDEMGTFAALSRMKPGQFDLDPRMYKYGGLWVYPVGAVLKVGSLLGLVDVKSDLAYYLDRPEAFGRFYIAARLYTVAWLVAGVWAAWAVGRRLADSPYSGAAAALVFLLMPVVVTLSHEAKPHLPGVVLTLLAIAAAARGRVLLTGLLCGAAIGMVATSWPVAAVVGVLAWEKRCWKAAAGAAAAMAGVFVLTNPYIVLNLLTQPGLVLGNVAGNVEGYHPFTFTGLGRGLLLLGHAATWPVILLGLAGVVLGARKDRVVHRSLAIIAGLGLAQYLLMISGQGPDYARFGLAVCVSLCVFAASLVAYLHRWQRIAAIAVLAGLTAFWGVPYLLGFIRDTRPMTTRLAYAEQLERLRAEGRRTIAMTREPAPYCMPPANLFECKWILLPRDYVPQPGKLPADVLIEVDHSALLDTPISWASKGFAVKVAGRGRK